MTNETLSSESEIEIVPPESLTQKLWRVVEQHNAFPYKMTIRAEQFAKEALLLFTRIVNDGLSAKDIHWLLNEEKTNLGFYHAANYVMMAVCGMLSQRRGLSYNNQDLLRKLTEKYRMRPELEEFFLATRNCKIPLAGLNPIIQVEHADIKILSPGNLIGKTIQYGKQRE